MPTTKPLYEDMNWTRYSDKTVTVTVPDLPLGTTATKMWLGVKADPDDDVDAEALVLKEITTSLTEHGQITDDGSGDQEAVGRFDLSDEETAATPAEDREEGVERPFYDIKVLLSNGKASVVQWGRVTALDGVTRDID